MKSRDQILLEEAYNKTRLIKEGSLEDFNDSKIDREKEHDLKEKYKKAFNKYSSPDSEMTSQQFGDICALILGELWGNDLVSKHSPSTTGEDFEMEDRAARL